MAPEWMIGRQGLCPEDIQRRSGKLSAVKGGDQVFIHQMRAPPGIDDTGPFRQLGKKIPVQDVFRFGGQREQADQNFRARQKRLQLVIAEKACDSFDIL